MARNSGRNRASGCERIDAITRGGQTGAALEPLYDLHKRFILNCRVVHADETPVALLDPGAGKTRRAYMWAYDPEPFLSRLGG